MTAGEIHDLINYRKDKIRKKRRDKGEKRYIKQEDKNMVIEKEEEEEKK